MPKTMGMHCPYPNIYKKARSIALNGAEKGSAPKLPIDNQGACIFHSRDIEWKRQNDFEGHFLKLLHMLNADETHDFYNFAEFIFVGNELRTKPDSTHYALSIKDITIPKRVYFTRAFFVDTFEIERVNFENGATFDETTFASNLKIKDSRFSGLSFISAQLKQQVLFSNVDFLGYTLFENAKFTGNNGNYSAKFQDSRFQGLADFSGAIFAPLGIKSIVFSKVRFENFADFTNTQFHNHIVFKDVSFSDVTEFIDTLFDTTKSSARYGGAAVEFERINVMKNAVLNFKSTDPQNKIFNHDVLMSFKEDPVGIIRFENVNLSHFLSSSRKQLLQLAKSGRVEIGSGCIKYRFQTDVRTISVSEGNTPLIIELCQTFTNYFIVSNGINLGLEIVERSNSEVSFFYFTDEDISEEIFLEKLANTERQLWNLLSINPDKNVKALEESGSTKPLIGRKDSIINKVDGISALIGTLFRVGARIAIGTWKEADTKALLGAIQFNTEDTENRAISLHRVLMERYADERLFAFSQQQNENLSPMKENQQFLQGQVSALNQTVKLLSNKGNKYIMGDTYNVSGQAVAGPNANAHDIAFNQIGNMSDESMDFSKLAEELSRLRQVMSQEAKETEQYIAVGNVAKAEKAAEEKDSSKLVNSLKSAGVWALDVATKIGVSLVTETIKHSMGMK